MLCLLTPYQPYHTFISRPVPACPLRSVPMHVRFNSRLVWMRVDGFHISGQLCTDLEEVIQAQYHQQIFAALIPTLEVPEPRYFAVGLNSLSLPDYMNAGCTRMPLPR
jgi:hypothetical protein